MKPDLKVIEHSPRTKLVVESLSDRIRAAIADIPEGQKITVSEIVGALEIVKHEFIKGLMD
jgi:hypothetical protein